MRIPFTLFYNDAGLHLQLIRRRFIRALSIYFASPHDKGYPVDRAFSPGLKETLLVTFDEVRRISRAAPFQYQTSFFKAATVTLIRSLFTEEFLQKVDLRAGRCSGVFSVNKNLYLDLIKRAMPPKIAALPLELLFSIVSYLNFEEFVKLGQTNKKLLGEVLRDERINKEMVKVGCQPVFPTPNP